MLIVREGILEWHSSQTSRHKSSVLAMVKGQLSPSTGEEDMGDMRMDIMYMQFLGESRNNHGDLQSSFLGVLNPYSFLGPKIFMFQGFGVQSNPYMP